MVLSFITLNVIRFSYTWISMLHIYCQYTWNVLKYVISRVTIFSSFQTILLINACLVDCLGWIYRNLIFSVRSKFEVNFKWATFYVICGCLCMFKMTRYYYENSKSSELTPFDAINLCSLLNHVFYVKFIAMTMPMIPFQSLN